MVHTAEAAQARRDCLNTQLLHASQPTMDWLLKLAQQEEWASRQRNILRGHQQNRLTLTHLVYPGFNVPWSTLQLQSNGDSPSYSIVAQPRFETGLSPKRDQPLFINLYDGVRGSVAGGIHIVEAGRHAAERLLTSYDIPEVAVSSLVYALASEQAAVVPEAPAAQQEAA